MKHKLLANYDPEQRRWDASCTCNKWAVVLRKTKEIVKRDFDKHVKEASGN